MSTREGLLERLLNWAVGALGEVRSPCGPADNASFLIPAREQAPDEPNRHDRRDYEREIELRVLMSTWM
jgi:hypothetical protein